MTTEILPAVRTDALPENTRYPVNEGCAVMLNPCLECVLPRCVEDMPGTWRQTARNDRNAEIRKLHKQGKPIAEIASKFGVATRTVHRVCKPT